MFKFRLQRLLDLREQKEREKAVALARAETVYDAARAALASLEAVRTIGRQRLQAAHATDRTVGQLRHLVFVLEQLDQQVAEAEASVREAEQQTAQTRDDLSAAHVERRVLDKLGDRHEADWRELAVQTDRQTMDTIALARFTRTTTAGPRTRA